MRDVEMSCVGSQQGTAEQKRHSRFEGSRLSHASPRNQIGVAAARAGRIANPIWISFPLMIGRGQHVNEEICKSKWTTLPDPDPESRNSNKSCASLGPGLSKAGYLRPSSVARGGHKL